MFFVKYEELCKKFKKTTTGVASELGVAKSTVAYWRSNHNVIPKQEILIKIADYFNVSVDYLLGNDVETNPDDLIKFALFGGDAEHISDEAFEDVKRFAQIVAEKERRKRENGNNTP